VNDEVDGGEIMIVIMTAKKLKKICQDYYSRGLMKGSELGYKMRQAEKTNRGFIIGSEVDKEIEEILKKKWTG
jgi:hypothetical protein